MECNKSTKNIYLIIRGYSFKEISDNKEKSFFSSIKNIKGLNISNSKITTEYAAKIITKCLYLKDLNISNNNLKDIKDDEINAINGILGNLKSLNLLLTEINLRLFIEFIKRCPLIEELNLIWVSKKIRIDCAKNIIRYLEKIKKINIHEAFINNESINFFKEKVPNVLTLE